MTIEISTGLNEARLVATRDYINLGGGNPFFAIYGNTRPVSLTVAPGAAPLVIIQLTKPPGVVDEGMLTLTQLQPGQVQNNGVATWARLFNGDDQPVLDCDCSDAAGTAELKLNNVALFQGAEVSLVSAVLG